MRGLSKLKKEKSFFAKSVNCFEGEGQLVVGFADDPLDSTEYLCIILQRTPKGNTSYEVEINEGDAIAWNAINNWELNKNALELNFSLESQKILKYESAKIKFADISAAKLKDLRASLSEILGNG